MKLGVFPCYLLSVFSFDASRFNQATTHSYVNRSHVDLDRRCVYTAIFIAQGANPELRVMGVKPTAAVFSYLVLQQYLPFRTAVPFLGQNT